MNKQTQELKSFLYSQYFADGIRITLGYVVPILVFLYLGEFKQGMVVSLGALLVGLSDTPGAPAHRRTGMFATMILSIITFVITTVVNQNIWLTTILIAVLCFIFAMFAVFNDRGATVGMMCILMMLIEIETHYSFAEVLSFLGYYTIGCIWYIIISLSFTQVMPYRLAQQELAESIRHLGDYIRIRANFYDQKIDNDANFLKLIQKQVEVHQHQEKTREILFLSKKSIKDTTKIGRYLTLILTDVIDLFEQSMATQYDYNEINKKFGSTGVLEEFRVIIIKFSNELDHLAYYLNANKKPKPLYDFSADVEHVHQKIDALDKEHYNTIPLKKILVNIRNMVKQINDIYSYSNLNHNDINKKEIADARKFVESSPVDFKLFRENLSLNSVIFRHAMRMSIVMSVTFFIAKSLNISENIYWLLLTILVILKPGFGLTKERNIQRLIGTIIGGLIGFGILLITKDQTILFILLIFFFLIAYSLFRISYITAVIFMTPYVLIMFSFISHNNMDIAVERIIDTFLGGMIAFLSSYIIFPNWENNKIRPSIYNLLIADYQYLCQPFLFQNSSNVNITDYKLRRKSLYVETANMGSTFQRMLTEPKKRQQYVKEVNRFVIFNHLLTSYCVAIIGKWMENKNLNFNAEHYKILKRVLHNLEDSINLIEPDNMSNKYEFLSLKNFQPQPLPTEKEDKNEVQVITDQLNFLNKISGDIHNTIVDIHEKARLLQDQKLLKTNA